MELIIQNHKYDCGLACLAMISGKTISDIISETGRTCNEPGYGRFEKLGFHDSEIETYLFLNKYVYYNYNDPRFYDIDGYVHYRINGKLFTIEIDEVKKLIFENKLTAIVTLPSKIHSNYLHYVVIYDGKIYDPSFDRENIYTDEDDIDIISAIIIGDKK